MSLLIAFAAAALAADPVVSEVYAATVEADGTVRVEMLVANTPAEVLAILEDPVRTCKLSPDVATATRGASKGPCTEMNVSARAPGATLDYRSMRCRTATGYRDSLVDSAAFTRMDSEWTVDSTDAGTRVVLRVHTAVTGLPEFLVRSSVSRSVSATANNLLIALGVR